MTNWKAEMINYLKEKKPTNEFEMAMLATEFQTTKLDEYEAKIAELEKKIEKMKCCGNCKYNDIAFVHRGCDGNCVKIDGVETWQDWKLKESEE